MKETENIDSSGRRPVDHRQVMKYMGAGAAPLGLMSITPMPFAVAQDMSNRNP